MVGDEYSRIGVILKIDRFTNFAKPVARLTKVGFIYNYTT